MARIYKSSQNGGAYIFVRGTFGKFLGIFVAFMLYVGMPFMITNQVMMLIKGTFSPSFVADIGGNTA
jgi:amino acid transporter